MMDHYPLPIVNGPSAAYRATTYAADPVPHPDRRVRHLSERWRPETYPLDPTMIARQIGVDVQTRTLPPTTWGATLPSGRIVVNGCLDAPRQRFALAHELGHILVKLRAVIGVERRDEELFCDRLARQLLAPLDLLVPVGPDIDLLASRFGVTQALIHSQFALIGLGLPLYRIPEGSIICRRCGEFPRDPACRCAPFRSAHYSVGPAA